MQHLKIWPALIVLSPVLNVNLPSFGAIIPLTDNIFHNKLASNVPNNMLKNLSFCSLASFLIVLLKRCIVKPMSSRDLTIFMISSISSFEIISVIPDCKNLLNSCIFC